MWCALYMYMGIKFQLHLLAGNGWLYGQVQQREEGRCHTSLGKLHKVAALAGVQQRNYTAPRFEEQASNGFAAEANHLDSRDLTTESWSLGRSM